MAQTFWRILVYGAGGHAKVILDAALKLGWEILLIDDNPALAGETRLGVMIRNSTDILTADAPIHVDGAVVAIGDNRVRAHKASELRSLGYAMTTIIHPSAMVSASAIIADGAQIAAGVVVNAEARIGENVILNSSSVVEHDCVVDAFAHIAPHATLGGGVHVGRETLIGLGAQVLPGVRIGANATVGAGAVVTHDLPDGVTAIGIPARILRQ